MSLYDSTEAYKVVQYKNRQEWLQGRVGCITASDSSSILGLNPYKTKEQYVEEKKSGASIKESKKGVLKYGRDNEELIRKMFELDYATKYIVEYADHTSVYSSKYPFLSCSPDALLLEKGRKMSGRKGILEIKTAYAKNDEQLNEWMSKIPTNYYIQVLHQMLVMSDLEFAIVRAKIKVYVKYLKEHYYLIKDYFIERKDIQADIDYLLEQELAFKEEYKELPFLSQ